MGFDAHASCHNVDGDVFGQDALKQRGDALGEVETVNGGSDDDNQIDHEGEAL